MRRHDDIRHRPERAVLRERLDGKHIEHRSAKPARFKRLRQRGFINQLTARDVDDDGAALHRGDRRRIEETLRFGGQRCGEYDDIRRREQAVPIRRSNDLIEARWSSSLRVPPHADDVHPERFRARGNRFAQRAHADNADRPSGEQPG